MFTINMPFGVTVKMKVEQAAKFVKIIQDIFPDCKIILETTDPDLAKNIENAKIFGKIGVRGKWKNIKEDI